MERFMTTKEASGKWSISPRRINILCKTGRIPGAYKENKQWMIPENAIKPADKRMKAGNIAEGIIPLNSKEKTGKKLPLPIGISDYRKASTEYYYVDKTLLIRDFIDERPQVSLFTRPRRFGKTLNMDMLRVFFEKKDEDTSIYFRDKKIWTCGQEYQAYQGKYPVIYVTFKDVKCENWKVTYDLIYKILRNEFERHSELLDSDKISPYEKKYLTGILRVAKESIFSGLNNLKINSVLDNRYSEYFGFAPVEVREMADYYGTPDKYGEICEWYDGYRFGTTEIFNPWSVIGYFNNECIPRAFWQSTGSNDIISEVLAAASNDTFERLESLMQGKSFVTHINTGVIYPQIHNNPSTIYSFLLVTGYLKAIMTDQSFGGDYICEVALPNKEISYVYSKEILSQFENVIPPSVTVSIQEAL